MAPSDLQQRNAEFRAFLDTLNPAQRRAVEQTEGPVLVIAGPGTGKTHILTARIGKILLDTDTRPQNILCLTFTDAAVSAMRHRLLERIGPEAHRAPIYTFHAFCNRVIQDNLEFFGRTGLEPLTDLERIEIIRKLLAQLPPEHPLRDGKRDPFQYETQLRDLFGIMKKESWTPGFVLKKINEFASGLSQNPDYQYRRNSKYGQKGDPKQEKIEAIREKMALLAAAADLFPRYLHALERAGRYEYEDMLLWVIRAFEQHKTLLRNYQERYLYVMVDEYQDTNGAQNRLLQLLLDYWEVPNIFIVGDDDQSIYEFQGARLKNLLEFRALYHNGLKTIVLEDNYRSAQPILDRASAVINQNSLRAVDAFDPPLNKILRAQAAALPTAPRLTEYPNRLHELSDIALQIEKLLREGVRPNEIAVLYARHRQAERLLTLLEKKGIPYQTKRPVNLLDLQHIRQFRELLHYLADELSRPFSGEHRLFRLLHARFFGLDPLVLAKKMLDYAPEKTGRRIAALSFREDAGLGVDLNTWISAAANLPLPALTEYLYNRTGLLAYALQQPDKLWWLQTLQSFFGFVQAEAARNPRLTLGRLLALLDSMDDNRLPLELRQPFGATEGVQLLTAHAAKGLEFAHVFLLDCTEDQWERPAGGGNRRFVLPDTLTLSGEEDALEARRRLFYVAMTRAKHGLHISYSRQGEDGKPLTQTRFVLETGLEKTESALPADAALETQTLLLLEPERPVIRLPESAALDERLANFALSVSSMNRYLRCPLAFYYVDLLEVPETESEYGVFGQAMHAALQQFFLKKMPKGQLFPSAEVLQKLFGAEMDARRSFFSEQNFVQRTALGKDYLRRYHAEQILPNWRRRAVAERRVDRVQLDGVPLTGVLDKIEWLDNGTLRVTDYKTGTPDLKKAAPPSDVQPNGADYWRQLAFYKILLEQSRLYLEPLAHTVISWLEPDRKGVFLNADLRYSGEEMRFVESLIRETYAKIRAKEFTVGCGKADCVWCRMHAGRDIQDGFDKAEEGLDDA
jgi:DNA helicase II / ATP-dependent DNA helicase PcrA